MIASCETLVLVKHSEATAFPLSEEERKKKKQENAEGKKIRADEKLE